MAGQGSGATLPETWEFKMTAVDHTDRHSQRETARKCLQDPQYRDSEEFGTAHWRFQWTGSPAHLLKMHEERIHIEEQQADGSWVPLVIDRRPVDDQGYDIALTCLQPLTSGNQGLYEVRWYVDKQSPPSTCRFAIRGGETEELLYSPPFGLNGNSLN